MGEAAEGPPLSSWVLSRRQLLGAGVIGAAGLAVGAARSPTAGAADRTDSEQLRSPNHLTVDGLGVPIGLALDDIYFAWHVRDGRRGATQSAYRIQVSGPVTGSASPPVVWDSGKVDSSQQSFVAYRGPRLAPDTAYHWTVQTWDGSGNSGPGSLRSTFETGLANDDWRASWIWRVADKTTEPDQYTYARTEFTMGHGPVERARAYVSGDQQYELYVNGVRAGKGQAYSYPDSKYYETVDVTHLLRPGHANAVGMVGNWQGPTKGHPAGTPGVIAQISIHYDNGHHRLITTDETWRVHPGAWLPGHERDLEGDQVDYTENINGPAQPVGWQLPAFDDAGWSAPVVLGRAPTAPWTHLVSVRTRIVEEPVHPVSVTTLSSGAVVADFGKVYSAVPTVTFRHGVPGRAMTMRAGYLLDQPVDGQPFSGVPGQVSTEHGTQHTDMSYGYVQRGGTEVFHPFDYLGFRYFQIDDPGEPLTAADVVALSRHTATPTSSTASFSSDRPVIDAIFELGQHSALFTAQEQFVDTPTREKGPWLFDGFNESCTAMAAVGEQNLTRKSLLEFGQSQKRYWPNGAVNKIYPTSLGALDINESTEIYPEWVWQYWMHTGDRSLLAEVYDVLVGISDYVQRAIAPASGLVTSLPATNVYYWYPVVTRLNVLGANVFRRTADVAQVVGRPAHEVSSQRHRQLTLTAAINRHLTRADGTYLDGRLADGTPTSGGSQTASACALAYQIVPAAKQAAVARYVASLGMQAAPQNGAEVLRAVAAAGLYPEMVGILSDSTDQGWANTLSRGATFCWEVWNPSDANGDSMSHGWGSNVTVEIQRWLLGVRPTEPGFATFTVTPPTGGLTRAQGSVPTPRGMISVAWSRPTSGSSGFSLDVTVPPNSTATVLVPAPGKKEITEGGKSLDKAEGVRFVSAAGGTSRLELGAGEYQLRVASPT